MERETVARECVRASEVKLQKSLGVVGSREALAGLSREHREAYGGQGRGSSA